MRPMIANGNDPIQTAIDAEVAKAPPLTPRQIDRLRGLFTPPPASSAATSPRTRRQSRGAA